MRVRFRSPGEVLWRLGETLNRGWVVAAVGDPVQVGRPVEVEFRLPGLGTALRTSGEVLDLVPGEPGDRSLSRVGFAALTDGAKAEIDGLLRSYRRPPPRALPH